MEIKVNLEDLRKRKLFVGTPMYGGVCAGIYTRSIADLAALCRHYEIQLQIYFLFNESLIARARNYICDEFMRSESTHLMFIDADIGFNPNDVIALLAMQSNESEYDVIGGTYPKKCISFEKVKQAVDKGFGDKNPNDLEKYIGDYVFNPKSGTKNIQINEPSEVLDLGTGFMMIRKQTFERFNENFPEMLYTPDHVRTKHFDGSRRIMAYFQDPIDNTNFEKEYKKILIAINNSSDLNEVKDLVSKALSLKNTGSNRHLSEDYFFTQMAQKINLKVWLCPWMQLQHVGSYIFGGSLADLAVLGASPTADIEKLRPTKPNNRPATKNKKGR